MAGHGAITTTLQDAGHTVIERNANDEPTRGVDVRAKYEIYALADRLAAGGGVLLISSELEELIGMCDRILVMSRGEIIAGFTPPSRASRTSPAPSARWSHERSPHIHLRFKVVSDATISQSFQRLALGPHCADPCARMTRLTDLALRHATLLIFVAVLVWFGAQTPGFLAPGSLGNIVKQAAFIRIAAIGMTFVRLTAGIDLSVGSVMYLAPLVAGFAMRDLGLGVAGSLLVAVGGQSMVNAVRATATLSTSAW